MPGETAGGRPGTGPRAQAIWLGLLFLLAVALRLAWIIYADVEPHLEDDTGAYQTLAENLADGRGYVRFQGIPTAFRPVGYPALLAGIYKVVGNHPEAAQALNALLGGATAVLTFVVASIVANRRAAWFAGGAIAVFPGQVFFSSLVMTEVTYTALFLLIIAALLAMMRGGLLGWSVLLALGLLLGYASLMRGETMLLPILVLPFLVWGGRSWRATVRWFAVVVVGMALIIAPWTIRNVIQMHSFILVSSNVGVTLWQGHNDNTSGRFQFADELFSQIDEPDPVAFETRVNQLGLRESLRFALANPLEEVRLTGVKLFWMFSNDEEPIRWNEAHGSQPFLDPAIRRGLLMLSNGSYFLLLGSFVLGVLLWLRRKNLAGLFVLAVLGYWTASHIFFLGDSRYHFPMVPLMAIFGALAWAAVLPSMRLGRVRDWHLATAFRGS